MIPRVLLILAVVFAISGCDTPKQKPPQQKQQTHMDITGQEGDVNFQAFVGRLNKAVQFHDVQTLASMMTPDFGYSLDPVGEGDGVFQYWDQNNIWPELAMVLQQKFLPKGDFMVSPPQFAVNSQPAYTGYRAGIRMINGAWKFAYFVKD